MTPEHLQNIEKLYLSMYDRLFVYARSVLPSDALAEEAVQETFQIACLKADKLCSSPNPEGWLVNTLKNVLSNTRRRNAAAYKIMTEYLSARLKEYSYSEDRISFEVLYENVAEPEEFKLLKEMTIDGRSLLEMARDRGISLSACKKRIQRAKETLRNKIHL